MIMRLIAAAAGLAAALAAPSAQAATVVDFSPLIGSDPYYTQVADGYSEGGLVFNSSTRGYLFSWGPTSGFNPDPTGRALSVSGANMDLIVTAANGGVFDLISLDLTGGFNGKGGVAPFTWTDATGAHSQNLAMDQVVGLQTFVFNLKGLTQFTLKALPPKIFQVDNIVVDFPAASAVPEPSAWALMIAGFGLTGAALRRSRRGAAAIR
jgi:hypothetical protein